MANITDETTTTDTDVAVDAQTETTAVSTDGSSEVVVFIDDGEDDAPADFTLIVERYSAGEDRWMEYSRVSQTGASNPQSVTTEAVPSEVRASVVNDSSGVADFRVSGS